MARSAVDAMINFQETGEGFDVLWPQIAPVLTSAVKTRLKKHLVTGPGGVADESAVEDCTQDLTTTFLRIGAGELEGKFDPSKCEDPVSGLKRWLYTIAMNRVRSYSRTFRGARSKTKVGSLNAVKLNGVVSDQSGEVKDRRKYDPDAFELTEIVRASVKSLSDYDRELYRLVVVEGMPQRQIAGELDTSAATVNRDIKKMMGRLTKALAARGIEGNC